MSDSILASVADSAGVDAETAALVVEEFLMRLHKMEYESNYEQFGFIENIWQQLSPRAFYHLLGFIEFHDANGAWETGYMGEYLGRMPPEERWEVPFNETKQWKLSR